MSTRVEVRRSGFGTGRARGRRRRPACCGSGGIDWRVPTVLKSIERAFKFKGAMGHATTLPIGFETHPHHYKHWRLSVDGPIATLSMDVREDAGLSPDYRLKLNSYDLGGDIELADAVPRIRFEHPAVRTVLVTSLKER